MKNNSHPNTEKTILAAGRFLQLVKENGWEYAERPNISGIVAMVPFTGSHFIFVEQFRQPVHANVIEFPAGLAGDKSGSENESLTIAAQRELEEEIGYRAAKLTKVAEGPASAGAGSEIITYYLAEELTKVGQGGGEDANEKITVHTVPAANVEEWLSEQEAQGKLIDLKIYTGLYFANKLANALPPSSR